jgi:hypothetical protein
MARVERQEEGPDGDGFATLGKAASLPWRSEKGKRVGARI